MPSHWKRMVSATAFLTAVCTNFYMCQDDLNGIPHIGEYYTKLAISFEETFFNLFPFHFGVVSSTSMQFKAAALDEFGACMAVHSTLQLCIGYLLPMAILIAEETISRQNFELNYANIFKFKHHPKVIMAQYLLFVPIETFIAFEGTLRIMHLLDRLVLVK